MASYLARVTSPRPPAEVFDYMARFSNAAEWDPGVVEATEVNPGVPALGSTYRLVVRSFGRATPLEYRIVEMDRPHRVVLRAENSAVRSTDVIAVSSGPGSGSTLTYDATLDAQGCGRPVHPPPWPLVPAHRGPGHRRPAGHTGDMIVTAHAARSALARMTDAVAEATVAPSFSRIGIRLRCRLEEWDDPPLINGRAVLVTGATSGIGLATATALAGLGADVHLVGRDPERGATALGAVEAAGPGQAHLHLVDISDPAAVGSLGKRLDDTTAHLDALVHNAGALTRTYQTTASGVERTLATHVLGPYLLTAALAPVLFSSPRDPDDPHRAPAIIVTVSSGGMYSQRFDLGALETGPEGYDGVIAYAKAKRAQLVLAAAWAGRFAPAGVASYSMHPGWVDDTRLVRGSAPVPLPRTSAPAYAC